MNYCTQVYTIVLLICCCCFYFDELSRNSSTKMTCSTFHVLNKLCQVSGTGIHIAGDRNHSYKEKRKKESYKKHDGKMVEMKKIVKINKYISSDFFKTYTKNIKGFFSNIIFKTILQFCALFLHFSHFLVIYSIN